MPSLHLPVAWFMVFILIERKDAARKLPVIFTNGLGITIQ